MVGCYPRNSRNFVSKPDKGKTKKKRFRELPKLAFSILCWTNVTHLSLLQRELDEVVR